MTRSQGVRAPGKDCPARASALSRLDGAGTGGQGDLAPEPDTRLTAMSVWRALVTVIAVRYLPGTATYVAWMLVRFMALGVFVALVLAGYQGCLCGH